MILSPRRCPEASDAEQVEEPHVQGAPISGSALLELVLPRTG